MPITLDGTNGITTPTYGGADTSEYLVPVTQFKNRIINGAMMIDQRNAGASSVTFDVAGKYPVDRFAGYASTDGTMTGQQSSIAPTGFTRSIVCTTTVADSSIAAGQYACLIQPIEGFNISDLGWGTANAQTITLSFWTRSSLTGTFGGAISNDNYSRSYAFTYTISSANTWEYKTITIPGDTTGTWLTNNAAGIRVIWGLGVGSNFTGAAGSWAGVQYLSANGAVSVIGTLNATWHITGVQLEVGSTATSFDYRPYGTELQLCQRYYQTIYNLMACAAGTTSAQASCQFPVVMRAAPTIGQGGSGTGLKFTDGSSDFNPSSFSFTNQNTTANGFFGIFPNYSGMTSRSALSLASDGGRWVTLSIEL